ncbi:Hsp70/Hsp90 co-chaperone cns1 [Golovinomyces cichoracearum]|uniref:Hsp70/Hsp90 co-chaperone cns1 n=1 Tax=Golovinomyces cichoracearum TaxID=62708 RepID=A0A420IBD1_9PEZI|nr:Hsp70/Hsp90 co-chaperone cns1 [Golovinomyces cichoracearum]
MECPNDPSEKETTPALPPLLASSHNKSSDELLAELNKIPLFMTTLEQNSDLEAIQAIAYEGTALEVASDFKNSGNECFVKKHWKDAKTFYEKAIDVLSTEVRKWQRGEKSEANTKFEKKQIVSLLELCLVNRAACHLELQNYRSCIQDCGRALQINGKNIKAYYRSSKALLALNRITEADDACACGLAIDSKNSSLLSVSTAIAQQSTILTAKNLEKHQREKKNLLEAKMLNAALSARNITLRKTAQPPEMEDACIKLMPDPQDPTSSLCFPTLFLYPLHLESDFIKAFNETQCINDHLEYIFPLPWDLENMYTKLGVECYVETVDGDLSKVGKKISLLKVLTTNKIEIVDEFVKIFVIPKAKAADWLKDFKKNKVL